jgi:uncharacterized membrane protein YccC
MTVVAVVAVILGLVLHGKLPPIGPLMIVVAGTAIVLAILFQVDRPALCGLMVVVAVIAILLGAELQDQGLNRGRVLIAAVVLAIFALSWRVCKRWADFRSRAQEHSSTQQNYLERIERVCRQRESTGEEETLQFEIFRLLASAAYHGKLHRKYSTAAAHPWLPVSADPRPPG